MIQTNKCTFSTVCTKVLLLMAFACCGYWMLMWAEFWRCNAERICKHKHGHVLTEVKAEEDIQIKCLYVKHIILIFVLIMVRSGSKDLQRTRGLAVLCLIIREGTGIYSLKAGNGMSGFHQCWDTYIYVDKNAQKLTEKKEELYVKRTFSLITFPFVSLVIHEEKSLTST